MNLVIVVLVALSFFAIGATFVFYLAGQQRRETRRLERLPVQDAATFAEAPVGSEMIVIGTLARNETRHSSGLVAYALERWDVNYDSEEDYLGNWETLEEMWPSLLVRTSNGWVRTAAVHSIPYGGDTYSQRVRDSNSGILAGGILEGTIWAVGFQNGATLTAIGHKSDAGLLVPTRFYGGTPDALLQEHKQGNRFIVGLGVFFVLASLLTLIAGLGQSVLGWT